MTLSPTDAYLHSGNTSLAIETLSRALEMGLESKYLYRMRGVAYREDDRLEKALSDFDRAIELDNDYAPAYDGRAWTFLLQGQYDKARADAGKTFSLAGSAFGNALLGWIDFIHGDLESADQRAGEALAKEPDLWLPKVLLYRIHVARGQLAQAEQELPTAA